MDQKHDQLGKGIDVPDECLSLFFAQRMLLIEGRLRSLSLEHPGVDHLLTNALNEGHRLLPLLVLLSCEASGGRPDTALPAAIALEFCYQALEAHKVVHSDGNLTLDPMPASMRFGVNQTILAGHLLLSCAFHLLASLATDHLRRIQCYHLLSQALQDDGKLKRLSPEEYGHEAVDCAAQVRTQKVALYEVAPHIGALLAPADGVSVNCTRRFGEVISRSLHCGSNPGSIGSARKAPHVIADDHLIQLTSLTETFCKGHGAPEHAGNLTKLLRDADECLTSLPDGLAKQALPVLAAKAILVERH